MTAIRNWSRIAVMSILIIYITACKKDQKTGDDKPTQSFAWSIDNGPIQYADSSSYIKSIGFESIRAVKGTTEVIIYRPSGWQSFGIDLIMAGAHYSNMIDSVNLTIIDTTNQRFNGSFNGTLVGPFNSNGILIGRDTMNIVGTFKNIGW